MKLTMTACAKHYVVATETEQAAMRALQYAQDRYCGRAALLAEADSELLAASECERLAYAALTKPLSEYARAGGRRHYASPVAESAYRATADLDRVRRRVRELHAELGVNETVFLKLYRDNLVAAGREREQAASLLWTACQQAAERAGLGELYTFADLLALDAQARPGRPEKPVAIILPVTAYADYYVVDVRGALKALAALGPGDALAVPIWDMHLRVDVLKSVLRLIDLPRVRLTVNHGVTLTYARTVTHLVPIIARPGQFVAVAQLA